MNAPTRREFTQALAALGFASAPALAQNAAAIPDLEAYAAALETVVRYRFGRVLNEEQIAQVLSSLINRRFAGDALKKIELDNAEDPIAAFRAEP
jgi:hypothetical protein